MNNQDWQNCSRTFGCCKPANSFYLFGEWLLNVLKLQIDCLEGDLCFAIVVNFPLPFYAFWNCPTAHKIWTELFNCFFHHQLSFALHDHSVLLKYINMNLTERYKKKWRITVATGSQVFQEHQCKVLHQNVSNLDRDGQASKGIHCHQGMGCNQTRYKNSRKNLVNRRELDLPNSF